MDIVTSTLAFCAVVLGIAFIVAAYDHFYGPLAWAEDTDIFALMERWIFHPIGRQIHKVYPIYEDPEPMPWSELLDEIKQDATPEELRQLESAQAFYYEPIWDWPSFQLEKRPWDHEWDGF
jgi:hypothetical protein